MPKEKHVFSDDDIKYIIDNWGKVSPHSMKNKLGCTWYAVCKIAELHGLELPTTNEWTEKEISDLKELAEVCHYKEIAAIMDKTPNAIYIKARRLGITLIQDRRKWTKEEEDKLTEEWGTKSIEVLARNMKRTVFSLKVKAIRMNLGSMISNNTDFISVSDMVELLGVSRDRITTTWVKLGLKLKKKKLTNNYSYYVVTWETLIEFLKNNQYEWDSRIVEEYMLGSEPEWLVEKRKRDVLENPLWYRRWTEEEIKKAKFLFKSKKDYKEIASILNRSEMAVAILLRNMGYSYRLPKFWSGDEFKFLKDNYQQLTHEEIAEELGRTTKAVAAKCEEMGYLKRVRTKNEMDVKKG